MAGGVENLCMLKEGASEADFGARFGLKVESHTSCSYIQVGKSAKYPCDIPRVEEGADGGTIHTTMTVKNFLCLLERLKKRRDNGSLGGHNHPCGV